MSFPFANGTAATDVTSDGERLIRLPPVEVLSESQNLLHAASDRFPIRPGFFQSLPPCARERVETGAPAVVCCFPRSRNQLALFEPVQRRIKRTFFDLQQSFGCGVHVGGDSKAMVR